MRGRILRRLEIREVFFVSTGQDWEPIKGWCETLGAANITVFCCRRSGLIDELNLFNALPPGERDI